MENSGRDARGSEGLKADGPQSGDPRSDPNMIKVFDEYGRELFVTKEQWRKEVLPGTLKQAWNDPQRLYGAIVSATGDGFFPDVLDAAARLHEIDTNLARGACMYGIVLMKNHRLDEAEEVLRTFLRENGENGYVLTNLAKVYADRGDDKQAEATLWRGLEVDPNQTNAVGWHGAIYRDRLGDPGWIEAMRQVAALPGSWVAQLWLARAALDAHDLNKALKCFRESLTNAGERVPMELLMQMGGDLGNHGYLKELIDLTEPRFAPEIHGLPVGNNLIKAHLDLGEIEAARSILERMYALKRPDYKGTLDFWDTAIGKAQVACKASEEAAEDGPLQIAMAVVQGPVWLKEDGPESQLFAAKGQGGVMVSFLGSTAEHAQAPERVQMQMADAPGRMSRALPLFLTEQVWMHSDARAQALVPLMVGQRHGFVVGGMPWRDADAAQYSLQVPSPSDFVVISHLKCASDPWTVELRLIRSSDHALVGTLSAPVGAHNPEDGVREVAGRLLEMIGDATEAKKEAPPTPYAVPAGKNFGIYLLRLEQLLTVRCAGMEGFENGFLHGEREILQGDLQLCLDCPESAGIRLIFARTLLAMKRIRPEIMNEFKDKVVLLQQKKPLPGSTNAMVQKLFDEALSGS